MSERSERLFAVLSEIDEAKIDEASPNDRTSRFSWKKWGALAAALALVVGAGSLILPRMGSGGASTPGNGMGGAGSDGASTFMSYAGPVFPLTLKETDNSITAERKITLDFAPWVRRWWSNEEEANSRENLTSEQRQEVLDDYNEWYPEGGRWRSSSGIQVTDAYILTNTSAEDKTVSVLYPFACDLLKLWKCQPELTADGQTLETVLHAGPYSGGFYGVDGPEDERRFNLASLHSWEDYRALLEDGSYLTQAMGDYPDFSGTPVTVYCLSDPWVEDSEKWTAPSVRVSFNLDLEKTKVLYYGFNSFEQDTEKDWMGLGFFLLQAGRNQRWDGPAGYIIVLGEDITDVTIQGGKVLDWGEKDLPAGGVTIQRYETDLDGALRGVTRALYDQQMNDYVDKDSYRLEYADYEMYHGLFCEHLLSYGMLSDHPAERYDNHDLWEMGTEYLDRVFYLEAEVTVPAGGSVSLSADMWKDASFDFLCAHTENQGVNGYDMVTKLGSNLVCPVQTAVLEDNGQIEIVRQNFGFDLEQGIKQVTLDPDQEHYYLEVRRLPDTE